MLGDRLRMRGQVGRRVNALGRDVRDRAEATDADFLGHDAEHHNSNEYYPMLAEAFGREVIDAFANEYLAGRTPIPCIACNRSFKFDHLLDRARVFGADRVATGHYARLEHAPSTGQARLFRGADRRKDQSYFLFATTPDQLDYLRFPLGGMSKDETRQLAHRHGLGVADKPDSQDICFVPNGRYGDVVRRLRPGAVEAGEIVHLDGTVLGHHDGVIDYTIGQRRGLGIGGRKDADEAEGPLYVVAIDAASRRVIVGPQSALACHEVRLTETSWVSRDGAPAAGMAVLARLRNTAPSLPATIDGVTGDRVSIRLDEPQFGISAGQAAVLYDPTQPDRVLGGGWIAEAPSAAFA